jgi:hypothetical protein
MSGSKVRSASYLQMKGGGRRDETPARCPEGGFRARSLVYETTAMYLIMNVAFPVVAAVPVCVYFT